jgi:hypothetical protein
LWVGDAVFSIKNILLFFSAKMSQVQYLVWCHHRDSVELFAKSIFVVLSLSVSFV